MFRLSILAVCALLMAHGTATAHFVFIVPDGLDTSTGRVILADGPVADAKVDVTRLKSMNLQTLAPGTNPAPLKWKLNKDESCYTFKLSGSGTRFVVGSLDYGVLKRGSDDPFWLRYHAKAIFGPVPGEVKPLRVEGQPIEIVPSIQNGQLRFHAYLNGKAYPDVAMRIHTPDEKDAQTVQANNKGQSKAFSKPGRYAVTIRHTEKSSGLRLGEKYSEVRHYASLVVYLGEKK